MKARRAIVLLMVAVVFAAVLYEGSLREIPDFITYGVSFSKLHSEELGLDWKQVYEALLTDLEIKHLRLSAHWPMIEPKEGEYNFVELDYQINEAGKYGADVILAVGKRLPGWPECHIPEWASNLPGTVMEEKILSYLRAVVGRYKDRSEIRFWQAENEPFLGFASEYCGKKIDEDFFSRELELIRGIDPERSILVTDGGELGLWYKARKYGDIFGSSVYLYIWGDTLGPFRYPITPAFFRLKQNIMDALLGPKESLLIELSAEPWLLEPIIKADFSVQLERMGIDKWKEMINFARETGFSEQYLWGSEWWYYMRENGYPEYWHQARELFRASSE